MQNVIKGTHSLKLVSGKDGDFEVWADGDLVVTCTVLQDAESIYSAMYSERYSPVY